MAGVKIHNFGVEVSGRVNRTYDDKEDKTTLTIDSAQAQELHEATGEVLEFISRQGKK